MSRLIEQRSTEHRQQIMLCHRCFFPPVPLLDFRSPCRHRNLMMLIAVLLLTLFMLPPISAYHSKADQLQQQQQQQQDMLLYKRSERQCSAGNFCKEEDFFHYYGCNFGICDFHLQPWLYVIVAFIVICFLLSVLISLINCVCCGN